MNTDNELKDPSDIIARCHNIKQIYENHRSEISYLKSVADQAREEWRNVTNERQNTSDERERWRLGQEQARLIQRVDRAELAVRALREKMDQLENHFSFDDCPTYIGGL